MPFKRTPKTKTKSKVTAFQHFLLTAAYLKKVVKLFLFFSFCPDEIFHKNDEIIISDLIKRDQRGSINLCLCASVHVPFYVYHCLSAYLCIVSSRSIGSICPFMLPSLYMIALKSRTLNTCMSLLSLKWCLYEGLICPFLIKMVYLNKTD